MHVLESLSWHCRTASPLQPGKGQVGLPRRLDLVIALMQIDAVRDIWLAAPEWKPAFEGFFTVKVRGSTSTACDLRHWSLQRCHKMLGRLSMSCCAFQWGCLLSPPSLDQPLLARGTCIPPARPNCIASN